MMQIKWIACLCLPVLASLSCVPLDSYPTPAYSDYQPPYQTDYSAYHRHGDHHHHHNGERHNHYHPKNQWDDIAYRAANQNLSRRDVNNLNALKSGKGKKKH